MNAGPTVRRLRRERGEAADLWRPYWRQRRLTGEPHGGTRPPTAGVRDGGEPAAGARRTAHRSRRQRPAFPVSIGAALGLGPDRYVLVLAGRVGRLQSRPPGPEATAVDVLGRRLFLQPGPCLDDLLRGHLHLHRPSLQQWAAATAAGTCSEKLDDLPGQPLAAPHTDIDAFVHEQMIPCIRELGEDASRTVAVPPTSEREVVVPQMELNFAFLGPRWCSLVPFCGKAGNRLVLSVAGETYLALEGQPLSLAVARYDGLLEDAVRTWLPGDVAPATGALYRDEVYTVRRTPAGRYYVSQRIAPYAVEGRNKALYYFDGGEVGLQLRALTHRELFTPQCVQMLHDYRHMFIYGMGNYLCMPRDEAYGDELLALPLARAVLHHLESARMTLCGGYMPQNAVMHPVDGVGRRTISLAEVQRRKLPVYWYYKPRRSLRAKARSLVR